MSSPLATGVVLLLYLIGILPLALPLWRPAYSVPIATFTGVALVAIAFVQTGVLQRQVLARSDVSHLLDGEIGSDRCKEVIDALVEVRILAVLPINGRMVVNGDGWDQLPSQIQDAVVQCAQKIAGSGEADRIQVIRR